jgi:hypothetical protein
MVARGIGPNLRRSRYATPTRIGSPKRQRNTVPVDGDTSA